MTNLKYFVGAVLAVSTVLSSHAQAAGISAYCENSCGPLQDPQANVRCIANCTNLELREEEAAANAERERREAAREQREAADRRAAGIGFSQRCLTQCNGSDNLMCINSCELETTARGTYGSADAEQYARSQAAAGNTGSVAQESARPTTMGDPIITEALRGAAHRAPRGELSGRQTFVPQSSARGTDMNSSDSSNGINFSRFTPPTNLISACGVLNEPDSANISSAIIRRAEEIVQQSAGRESSDLRAYCTPVVANSEALSRSCGAVSGSSSVPSSPIDASGDAVALSVVMNQVSQGQNNDSNSITVRDAQRFCRNARLSGVASVQESDRSVSSDAPRSPRRDQSPSAGTSFSIYEMPEGAPVERRVRSAEQVIPARLRYR